LNSHDNTASTRVLGFKIDLIMIQMYDFQKAWETQKIFFAWTMTRH